VRLTRDGVLKWPDCSCSVYAPGDDSGWLAEENDLEFRSFDWCRQPDFERVGTEKSGMAFDGSDNSDLRRCSILLQ
jgi:hypothetical protein